MDPDGGVNLAKKRLEFGFAEELHPEVNENFPSTGFECGTTNLPRISYRNIWKYLIEDVELKKQLSTEKPIVKGYNFYKSGHVLQIFSKKEHNKHYVLSKVNPSMKKGKVYTVKIILCSNGDISNAFCCCPAGVDGRCNHLAATLFSLEDKTSMDSGMVADKAISKTPENIPCTSKPCTWNVPAGKRKLVPQPIQSVKFQKHEYGKVTKHFAKEYGDVRAPHQRSTASCDLKVFYNKVKEVEEKTGKMMGLSLILPHHLPEGTNNSADATEPQDVLENLNPDEYLWKLTSPDKSNPMSLNEISAKAERVKKRLFDSENNCETIESKTRDQHNSMLWYNVRKPRITAKICLLKENTSPTKAISEILMYKPRVQTCHMKKGIEMEPTIIERFSQETGNTVRKCGFFVSESHPYLGASPDGITEKANLIEVKYVTSKQGESMEVTLCRLGIYKKNGTNIEINNKHKYYHQIQQQLFCSNYIACHFVVSNGIWLHSELVEFNNTFWNNVVTQLETFYFTNIFPELVYPRVLYNEPRWNKVIPFPTE